MNKRLLLSMVAPKETRKVWPEIVMMFLALTSSGYALWTRSALMVVLTGILTVIALLLTIRDSGLIGWWLTVRLEIRANRVAKKMYPRFVKIIERAGVHRELVTELRNVDWQVSPVPHIAHMSFDDWYGDIRRLAPQFRVRRASEMSLIGSRFFDFLRVLNQEYFRPLSEELRQGHAKYRNEQSIKSARSAKDSYDRFLESYNEFCDEVNEAARRNVLVPIHYTPTAFDWDAAAPKRID
jgi:hypothetical protein